MDGGFSLSAKTVNLFPICTRYLKNVFTTIIRVQIILSQIVKRQLRRNNPNDGTIIWVVYS
jgi:hypothetical protein